MTTTAARVPPTGAYADAIRDYTDVPAVTSATRALSLSADYLRTDVDVLHDDVHELHGQARELDLNERAVQKGKKDVPALLNELAVDRGMAWSDIAELAQVSVSAVRKWRKGGDAAPENRARLAAIAALLDVLELKALVQSPAQWMEMELPLGPGYLIRPMDLYLEGHAPALLDVAEQRQPADRVLDQVLPGWRESRRSAFEVVTDTDGQRTIQLRGE